MSAVRLSAVVVAHNEEENLDACLATLAFCDEIVVVLDRCTDRSAEIARRHTERIIEGAWEIEGLRRNTGLDAATGDWIIELDADERVTPALADEIRETIADATGPAHYLIPFDNYVGTRRVRYGWGAYWGVSAAIRLFTPGAKRWGSEWVHPSLEIKGERRRLTERIDHLVDRDISDMIARLDRYTALHARDLRDSGDIGSLWRNVLRVFGRFWKCYIGRSGWREGGWGFLIALFAGLYPLLSHLRARLEDG
ncbi:MAG: glycosyltransferase family 2 protein [Rhodospirillales bacterium]|nr:glycosyltransferase family 2 protein [Rhodospirillales bacterium]